MTLGKGWREGPYCYFSLLSFYALILTLISSYRKSEEVKQFRKEKDPIKTAKEYALEGDLATEEELDTIYKEVKKEIDEDVKFATSGGVLPTEELYTDVYYNTPNHLIRGCDPFTWGNSERSAAAN